MQQKPATVVELQLALFFQEAYRLPLWELNRLEILMEDVFCQPEIGNMDEERLFHLEGLMEQVTLASYRAIPGADLDELCTVYAGAVAANATEFPHYNTQTGVITTVKTHHLARVLKGRRRTMIKIMGGLAEQLGYNMARLVFKPRQAAVIGSTSETGG